MKNSIQPQINKLKRHKKGLKKYRVESSPKFDEGSREKEILRIFKLVARHDRDKKVNLHKYAKFILADYHSDERDGAQPRNMEYTSRKVKLKKGIDIYKSVRHLVFPQASQDLENLHLVQTNHHQLLFYWEMAHFIDLCANNPDKSVGELYYRQYIDPVYQYHTPISDMQKEGKSTIAFRRAKEIALERLQAKLNKLAQQGASSTFLTINKEFRQMLIEDIISPVIANMMAMPTFGRHFLLRRADVLKEILEEEYISKYIPANRIVDFYKLIQDSLHIKPIKIRAKTRLAKAINK